MTKKEKILDEISRRAPHYTPEWRMNMENPDAGTALAVVWADMFEGTLDRFERMPDNYMKTLLKIVGADPKPAVSARGFLAFGVREDVSELIIPAGTVAASPENQDAALVTSYPIIADPTKVSDIYCVLPMRDLVYKLERLTDITLFKQRPSDEHVWTFEHDYALTTNSASVLRLTPETDKPDGLDLFVMSQWEYRDGGVWREMTVSRDGLSLLCVFPHDKQDCDAVRVKVSRDLLLRRVISKPSGNGMYPDALYSDYTQESDGFFLFGQRFLPGMCAYFSNRDALCKPGAQIELSFTLSFEEFEIEGYPEIQLQMRRIMRVSEFNSPEEYIVTASETKWEYYNGVGWASLDVNAEFALFDGNTTGRVQVTFDCPSDMSFAVVGAHDLPFVRVRLTGVENLYRHRGHYRSPKVSDIRFSYHYSDGVEISRISVFEHLSERVAKLPSRIAAPPAGPSALYFAFDTAFSQGAILFHLKPAGSAGGLRWEYLTENDWRPLNVRDDTAGLTCTELLNYQIGTPPHKERLWGRKAYWMRLVFTDNTQPEIYLYGLYENAVHAVARVPGEGSALEPGTFSSLVTPVAGVESCTNPAASFGGADAEDEERLIARVTSSLSHMGRSVSAADCEKLALEVSTRVLQAKYYPHINECGCKTYGVSTLVIFAHGVEEFGFDELQAEIAEYIRSRRPLGAEKLIIIPPRYFAVNVSAKLLIDSHGELLTVKNNIESCLQLLLRPENWRIGRLPAPGRISAALRSVTGAVRLIKSEVSYSVKPGVDAVYARVSNEPFVLPVLGRIKLEFVSGSG